MAEQRVTSSGLRITEEATGDGETAVAGQTAVVHYTGWLYQDGEKGDGLCNLSGLTVPRN